MNLKCAAAVVLALCLCATIESQESELRKDLAPFEKRRQALDGLLEESPDRFITESEALAAAYHEVGKRHAKVSQSVGARGQAVTFLRRAAFVARYKLRQPAKAIDLYRRAAALHSEQYPAARGLAFNEDIADIQQFDLGDHPAAAATLEPLQELHSAAANRKGEMAEWSAWKSKWLDTEIAYLRTKKRYAGNVDASAMTGFIGQLYFGAAPVVLLDPALNAYNDISLPPIEIEKKLAAFPASHTTFLQTWLFANKLPTPAAAQKWLARNDPAGYWVASLLTLAAVAERDLDASENPRSNVVAALVRTESGKPTAFALLAREYAKTHRLPPPMKLNIGH